MTEHHDTRRVLLQALAEFVRSASTVTGVSRIAVIGSLLTDKPCPRDADVLVTVQDTADLRALATLGRKLKGTAQARDLGADIFLASTSGAYLGRTCSYRECHPRRACHGLQCGAGRWLCDDLDVACLPAELIVAPPLELWPRVIVRTPIPQDTQRILIGERPDRSNP